MIFLAITYLVCQFLYAVLPPHSAYKNRPVIDWNHPHIYFGIIGFLASISLAIWVL